jgi:hypothetical protein
LGRIPQRITNRPHRDTQTKNQRIQDSHSQPHASYSPSSCEELTNIALSLRERVGMSSQQRFRLVGVGLSNFHDPEDASAQPALFT